jgi:hypothetical protein
MLQVALPRPSPVIGLKLIMKSSRETAMQCDIVFV